MVLSLVKTPSFQVFLSFLLTRGHSWSGGHPGQKPIDDVLHLQQWMAAGGSEAMEAQGSFDPEPQGAPS